jgi:hypothetical protein
MLVRGGGVDVLDTTSSDLLAVGEGVQRLVTSAITSDKDLSELRDHIIMSPLRVAAREGEGGKDVR